MSTSEFEWEIPRATKREKNKLISKIPMSNMCVDSEYQIWQFRFINGKIKWDFIAETFPVN